MNNLSVLFNEINKHTAWLVEKEILFWKEEEFSHDAIDQYLSFLEDIQTQLNELDTDREMILRVGHGSGWHFITGGWAKYLENLLSDEEFRQLSSLLGKRGASTFPKTRKMESIGELLGFIKISI